MGEPADEAKQAWRAFEKARTDWSLEDIGSEIQAALSVRVHCPANHWSRDATDAKTQP
jgi:hypothetical protein